MAEQIKLEGKPEFAFPGWKNSSNSLCKYMDKMDWLKRIIDYKAIIPRYVTEDIAYIGVKNLRKIAFPMICFCDIPFAKVPKHMVKYGNYGIGFDKNVAIKKFALQPIIYVSEKSPMLEEFKSVFSAAYENASVQDTKMENLHNYLLTILSYMKPVSDLVVNKDNNRTRYIFQDECEWRFLPEQIPEDIFRIVPEYNITKKTIEIFNEAMRRHSETWLKFEWDDVRYLVVPDESARDELIEYILRLNIENKDRHRLISKIEIGRRFTEDLL